MTKLGEISEPYGIKLGTSTYKSMTFPLSYQDAIPNKAITLKSYLSLYFTIKGPLNKRARHMLLYFPTAFQANSTPSINSYKSVIHTKMGDTW
jgi:hypothetical protein